MKKSTRIFMAMLPALVLSMPAFAATTVTVDDSKVTIDRNQPSTTTVVQEVIPQTVVVQQVPVIVTTVQDPKDLEGEIIRVDASDSQIVLLDADNRERKVLLKQGMIGTYKVGDYVQIHLMADLKEAKTIKTVRTADIDGNVVATDYARNQIVVRDETGTDRVVILNPNMSGKNVVGDHVRLYVVSESPNVKEVKLIRVR